MPIKRCFILLIVLFALAGCGLPSPGDATPTGAPSPTTEPLPTATPLPPTPTALPPLVILLAPEGSDPALQDLLEARLAELAPQYGLRWQLRQTITPEETAAEASYLVALPPGDGLNQLVSSAPGTRFLAVNIPGLEPAPNLINIGSEEQSPDQQAFLAGYIGALITPSSRIGMILPESEFEALQITAFQQGRRFYCGLCRPQFAPFYEYPFITSLPATASQAEWRALADFMRDRLVGTVYVAGGAGGDDLLAYLAQLGVNILGDTAPPEAARANWVAALRTDPLAAWLEYLPRLLDGEAGLAIPLPILLTDINADLLPAGKQRLVLETLADVQAGYISTGDPNHP